MMKNRIKLIRDGKKTSIRAAAATGMTILTLITRASFAGNAMPSDVRATNNKSYEVQLAPVIRIEPRYPLEAAQNNNEGSVLLKFDVNGEGDTSNISVIKGEPELTFDSAAIKALKQWKYNATGRTHLAQRVQFDFLLSASSERPKRFLERIEVKT